MSRNIKLSAFNIVTHPHSPEDYIEILRKARDLKQQLRIHGDRHAVLRSVLRQGDRSSTQPIWGVIFTYIKLTQDDWFRLEEGERATEAETGLIQIPDDLVPHLKQVHYVFFPETHLFVYVNSDSKYGGMSPRQMKGFLERILNDNRITGDAEISHVDVREVQSRETLDEMLGDFSIQTLRIQIKRPNDTGDEIEQLIEEEMEDQGIGQIEITNKSTSDGEITPNEHKKKLMQAALTNGYVEAEGFDANDQRKTLHTCDKPIAESFLFDDSQQTYFDFIMEKAREVARKVYPNRY